MLRKKDVVEAVGMAKSTVSDWITEFNVFIPTVKQGAVVYYLPETIDVLNAIKGMREIGLSKPQVIEQLTKRGFPITVDEAIEDIERIFEQAHPRDGLLQVMHGISQTMTEIGKQTERINDQDGKLDELKQALEVLRHELEHTKREVAVTREEASRTLWNRLFKKRN